MIEILVVLLIILGIALVIIFYNFYKLKVRFDTLLAENVKKLFDKWKETELENEKRKINEMLQKEFEIKFNKWVEETKEKISKEAIERSASVILGKVGEQLAPIFIFQKYGINPKDTRFLGTPIDYVAFEGLDQKNIEKITFIEVKSGKTTTLTPQERQIKDIIEKKKVGWIQINLQEELESIERESEKESIFKS